MGYKNNTKEYERILKMYSNDVYRMALLKTKNVSEAEDIFQNVLSNYTHMIRHLNQICT